MELIAKCSTHQSNQEEQPGFQVLGRTSCGPWLPSDRAPHTGSSFQIFFVFYFISLFKKRTDLQIDITEVEAVARGEVVEISRSALGQ